MKSYLNLLVKVQVLTSSIVMIIVSSSLYGQTYSAEEQGLIDQVENCFDAWIEGIEKGNPEVWYEKCPSKEDASMWWTNEGAPQQTVSWAQRNWDIVSRVDSKWVDLRPVVVRIWGDIGMVQFYGYWEAKTQNGNVVTEYLRTEVFKRENGSWIFLGGQGTPATQADADPY